MRPLAWIVALAACGAVKQATPTAPTGGAGRWVYRVYTSGVESSYENVTTFVVDEHAGAVDATERSRDGRPRNHVPWTDGPAMHWKLAVSRSPELRLSLVAADGTESRYACKPQDVEVAPALAVRVSAGGESTWKQGHWNVPTHRIALQACQPEAESSKNPPELLLAPEPIEHLIADDNCCRESPSLRLVPGDGAVLPPRDKGFPGTN